MTQHLLTSTNTVLQQNDASKQALQERWQQLGLQPATLLHLQELLDTTGMAAAMVVTNVVEREKRETARFPARGKVWGAEVLRQISLEGVRPHLVDLLRMGLESLLAWHLLALPAGALDGAVEMTLSALFLLISLLGIALLGRWHRAHWR